MEAAAIKTSPLELFEEDKRIINNTKQYQCIVFTSGEGFATSSMLFTKKAKIHVL